MEACGQVFERYEKKYLLHDIQYRAFMKRISGRFVQDRYGESTVSNIYYDTPDHRLIRASLEKPVYKEKLRMRSYQTPDCDDIVFLELKKKFKGVVYKRRIELPLCEAERHIALREQRPDASQIEREIDWFIGFYQNLGPRMYIAYDRIALVCREDPALRATFDTRILWREENLSLRAGAWGNELLQPGQYLLELKIPGAIPLWLAHVMDELKIYPASFSKYGMAYQASLANKRGMVVCA